MSDKRRKLRCAIYTRKSSDEGLEQDFNSLDAQREACEAYIASQRHEGWVCLSEKYDDGGISGATLERPALQHLLQDVQDRKIDVVVVYKVDRLTRALADFAKIVEVFDTHKVSFVSVTQQFNTTSSMGRLTLNVLLSFAQFEREVTAERIRDKIAASKKKGMWMGGAVPLGYEAKNRTLVINKSEAETVRALFRLYLKTGTVRETTAEANRRGLRTKLRPGLNGKMRGGLPFFRGHIYRILTSPIYIGQIPHKKEIYPGLHPAIIDRPTWAAVQDMMSGNRVARRSGSNAKHPSPLAGKLFDHRGNPFTPTHALKSGKRYRYYVAREARQRPGHPNSSPNQRIPAEAIEGLVTRALARMLHTPSEILEATGIYEVEVTDIQAIVAQANRVAKDIETDEAGHRHALLRQLVGRVETAQTEVRVQVDRHGLREALFVSSTGISCADNEHLMIVPAQLRPRGEELKFVITDPSGQQAPCSDHVLIKALVRAHQWVRSMTEDGVAFHQIAKAEGVTNAYIRRHIKLAFLAPDIVAAILDGQQPADLSLERITRPQEFPLDWDEQRRLFLPGSPEKGTAKPPNGESRACTRAGLST